MFNLTRNAIIAKAAEAECNPNILEKTIRLSDILGYLSYNQPFYHTLALVEGEAANLCLFDIKRLVIKLTFDFTLSLNDEETKAKRQEINDALYNYMSSEGYYLTQNSGVRGYFDLFEFTYHNAFGVTDFLTIEINYGRRAHIFNLLEKKYPNKLTDNGLVYTLDKVELLGELLVSILLDFNHLKIYDVYHIIKSDIINQFEFEDVQRCFLFYYVLDTKRVALDEDIMNFKSKMLQLINYDLVYTLKPLLLHESEFNIDEVNMTFVEFFNRLVDFNSNELIFLDKIKENEYRYDLLFPDKIIQERMKDHEPMIERVKKQ